MFDVECHAEDTYLSQYGSSSLLLKASEYTIIESATHMFSVLKITEENPVTFSWYQDP
jgi:hypothetical protein